ncbi:glycosyltransferase 7 [Dorcoceras hygrometricum]|uniref:Glycosyltransferase 7 n=1 Tax=Dorcoceras hygrometricum TaxID=472368 RepID=A0A2Z7AJ22_9LAMI|nr:glycosyltransferase 7 [Dorcoceras hygrometricum]
MLSSEVSQLQHFSMAMYNTRTRSVSFLSDIFLMVGSSMVAFLTIWALWSFLTPNVKQTTPAFSAQLYPSVSCANYVSGPDLRHDPADQSFYDDPTLNYAIDSPPIKNWDEKRMEWLKQHPTLAAGAKSRILMVTGRHDIEIFYNNVLLQPKMFSFWAKTPTIKAAMLAHPEAEWIWWVDSDAAITDMDFKLPLERYKNHNFVLHGWLKLIYETKSWTSINAGVFLIRNCQWSMDFMDVWASMGPQSPQYDKWGETLSNLFKDKIFRESDDQSGLVYLLLKEKEKWGDKIYVEDEYYFQGYWVEILGTFENITDKYKQIEKDSPLLRRRHAERVSEAYATVWEEYLKGAGYGRGSWRRPFITHFTGCQPCSGNHNEMYSAQTCVDAMQKALLFADNQVLRNYGFVHLDLLDPSAVNPLPFDYPA